MSDKTIDALITEEISRLQRTHRGYADTERAEVRIVNRIFRDADDSHKWPILGRFNATERAIRRLRHLRRECFVMSAQEYALELEREITSIVNDAM